MRCDFHCPVPELEIHGWTKRGTTGNGDLKLWTSGKIEGLGTASKPVATVTWTKSSPKRMIRMKWTYTISHFWHAHLKIGFCLERFLIFKMCQVSPGDKLELQVLRWWSLGAQGGDGEAYHGQPHRRRGPQRRWQIYVTRFWVIDIPSIDRFWWWN